MAIPSQTISIKDPGLGLIAPAVTTPLFLGVAEKGTANTLLPFSSKNDVVDTLGEGPMPEAVCKALDEAGGPILALRMTAGVAGSIGVVAKTGTGTGNVTTGGAPFDAYEVIVEITVASTGVTPGTGEFKYSLDDGRTFSESIKLPGGGTFTLPRTGVTITFVQGGMGTSFEKGDKFEFDTVAPFFSPSNLATAITAILSVPTEFAFLVLVGTAPNATDAAALFAALDGHLTSLQNQFRYVGALMDAGKDTEANAISAFLAQSSRRIGVVFGTEDVASAKPFAGWGTPKMAALVSVAARAAASLVSTDLGRVADGALGGVVEVSHDEFFNATPLDGAKFITLRTWIGREGFYITRGRIKSPQGSDFVDWQHRRVMDVACGTVFLAQQQFINSAVRVTATGTIDERDAVRIETAVTEALRIQLTQPSNAEGTQGHVSELSYRVSRTNNVLASGTVQSEVAIRPLGYAHFITTTIGFAVNVGG